MQSLDMSSKDALRRHFRTVRMEISEDDRRKWDSLIAERVLKLPEVRGAQVIFSYLANWGEVCTAEILRPLMAQNKLVLVPDPSHRALPEDGCHFLQMNENAIDIQPYRGPVCHMKEVDIFLVPGIVWSPDGYRVGFGGGYFDRLLVARKPSSIAIGLAYDCQVIDKVPTDEWDQRVDRLITQTNNFQSADKA